MSKKMREEYPARTWVRELGEIWSELSRGGKEPSGEAVAAAIGARLKIGVNAARGVVEGIEAIVKYAQKEEEEGDTAIEEERMSLKAGLEAVRPILEARMQRRLDEAERDEARCEGCVGKPE